MLGDAVRLQLLTRTATRQQQLRDQIVGRESRIARVGFQRTPAPWLAKDRAGDVENSAHRGNATGMIWKSCIGRHWHICAALARFVLRTDRGVPISLQLDARFNANCRWCQGEAGHGVHAPPGSFSLL
jgi:hypothetical protein